MSFDVVKEQVEAYQAGALDDFSHLQSTLLKYGLYLIGVALLKGLFTFFKRQTIIVMSREIEFDLKNEIFRQYESLTPAFYKRNNTGDLMNRISEDVGRVRMYLGPAVMYTIDLVVLIITVVTAMLFINVKLTLYTLAPLPVLAITIYYVSNIINVKSEKVQKQLSGLSTFVQEAFSGIRVIKSFVRENDSIDAFEKECIDYKDKNLSLATTNALFFPLMILLIGISTIFTIYIGGLEVISGAVTMGAIAMFVIFINQLTWPFAAIGWVTSLVQRAAASQERINEFLNQEPEIVNSVEEESAIDGDLRFENVNFTYPDTGSHALKNVSFHIPKGKSLAVIGKTGSGKSTIAYLLTRMYEPQTGKVMIDNIDLKNLNLNSVRQSIGYVPQEAFLFSDSIEQNIAFGKPGASKEEIITASKGADLHSNIIDFPESYNTKVGERGITLSGGQKQRVSIARAILKTPQILIFDDCLSAVDTETEESILNNLKKVMKNRTTLIISHRASSVKNADHIIVLDEGKIIEEGSPADLLKIENGYYCDLYQQQLKDESVSKHSL
jgi:ATP-binding cassette subfamily B multidrug efflux pump